MMPCLSPQYIRASEHAERSRISDLQKGKPLGAIIVRNDAAHSASDVILDVTNWGLRIDRDQQRTAVAQRIRSEEIAERNWQGTAYISEG